MAVPGYQDFMHPFLMQLEDKQEHRLQDLYTVLAGYFNLSDEDIIETLPSGKQTLLANRVGWARTYLNKAGLIKVVRRAVFQITEEGLGILNDPTVSKIDRKFLTKYASFNEFINKASIDKTDSNIEDTEEKTPLELMGENFNI